MQECGIAIIKTGQHTRARQAQRIDAAMLPEMDFCKITEPRLVKGREHRMLEIQLREQRITIHRRLRHWHRTATSQGTERAGHFGIRQNQQGGMAALAKGAYPLQACRRHGLGENEETIIRMRQLAGQRAGIMGQHGDMLRARLGKNALEKKTHLLCVIRGLAAYIMNTDRLGQFRRKVKGIVEALRVPAQHQPPFATGRARWSGERACLAGGHINRHRIGGGRLFRLLPDEGKLLAGGIGCIRYSHPSAGIFVGPATGRQLQAGIAGSGGGNCVQGHLQMLGPIGALQAVKPAAGLAIGDHNDLPRRIDRLFGKQIGRRAQRIAQMRALPTGLQRGQGTAGHRQAIGLRQFPPLLKRHERLRTIAEGQHGQGIVGL